MKSLAINRKKKYSTSICNINTLGCVRFNITELICVKAFNHYFIYCILSLIFPIHLGDLSNMVLLLILVTLLIIMIFLIIITEVIAIIIKNSNVADNNIVVIINLTVIIIIIIITDGDGS